MKRRKKGLLLLLLTVCTLAGCTQTEEEPPLVVIEQDEEVVQYEFATVEREDVILSQRVQCVYKQLKDEELSFELSGKRIDKVFVKKGDMVKKGDVLAQLSGGNLEQDIKRLEYSIARNTLLKEHAKTNEALDISQRWVNALCHGANFNVKEDVERIQRNYRYMQEDYDDALEYDQMELKKLKAEMNASTLKAGFDGMVYSVAENIEGTTSEKGKVVIVVIDNSECIFETSVPELKTYCKEGDRYEMTVSGGSAAGDYELMPWHIEDWDEKQYFSIYNGPDNSGIEVDTKGYMVVVLDKKEQVLSVPKETVNKAGEEYYVYVLGANNMREVRWVTVGLYGDSRVEIREGLAEGDKVIK